MIALLLLILSAPAPAAPALPEKYKKWLRQDVPYIISQRERKEFLALEDDAQREAFVEHFWRRRDPDLSTEINEFREEHYRRIAYANERFGDEGKPGWRTARGRVYIIHGPPDDVRYSFGRRIRVTVHRPTVILNPAGGGTGVAEVEIPSPESESWTYFNVEGSRSVPGYFSVIFAKMRSDPLYLVERWIKRVDPNSDVSRRVERDQAIKRFSTQSGLYMTGDFRILYAGEPRFVDIDELIRNAFHPYTPPVDQFELQSAVADLQTPSGEFLEKKLKRQERLRKLVESRVFFGELPLEVGVGFLKLLQGRVYIPLRARIDVPAQAPTDSIELLAELIKPDSGRVVAVLSDELRGTRRKPLTGELSYQSRLIASPGRYQLRVTAADERNQRLGLWEEEVTVPDLSSREFSASELVLCDKVIPRKEFNKQRTKVAKRAARQATHEALLTFDGNVFVPAVRSVFRRKQNLTTLLEVYNPSIQAGVPQVRIRSTFKRPNAPGLDFPPRRLDYLTDKSGKTIIYAFTVPLRELDPGNYEFTVEVTDSPTGKVIRKSVALRIR